MKKALLLVAIIAVCSFAAMAQASTVSFSWGANFITFADNSLGTSNGTAAALQWYVDDMTYGVRTERNTILEGTEGDDVDVTEVTIDKWINKFVSIGIGVGSLSTTNNNLFDNNISIPEFDVRGTVQLLASHGEKINASVDFNVIARYAHINGNALEDNFRAVNLNNLNGVAATLGVTLGL